MNENQISEDIDELEQISRVALLIDELNNEDTNIKLNAMQKITNIANVLG